MRKAKALPVQFGPEGVEDRLREELRRGTIFPLLKSWQEEGAKAPSREARTIAAEAILDRLSSLAGLKILKPKARAK